MFDSVRITTWLFIPFLLFFKGQFLEFKTFQEFSRLFHCSVIKVLKLFLCVSLPEQLWYHIIAFSVCQQLFSTFLFLFIGAVLISEVCIRLFPCLCGVFRSDVLHNTTTFLRCQHLFLKFFKFFVFYILYLFFIHFRLFLINFKSCESNRRTLYVTFWTEHMQKNAAASKVFLAFDATAPFSILSINMLSYRCWSAVIFQASRLIF